MATISDLTTRDLSDGLNRSAARGELRSAQDLGGDAERASRVSKWGDAVAELLLTDAEV